MATSTPIESMNLKSRCIPEPGVEPHLVVRCGSKTAAFFPEEIWQNSGEMC